MRIYDISPPLSEQTSVWPGDVHLSRKVQMQMEKGDSVDLSCLMTTVHIGAHADAPSHYHREGQAMHEVSLEPYLGPCHVVHCVGSDSIKPEHLASLDLKIGTVKRVLFRTRARVDYHQFDTNFAYFETETLEILGTHGVILVGLDTPSVDHFSCTDMRAHNVLYKHGMRNLEGLDLSEVPEGHYDLAALPLRLVGFDGSPVRAVLRPVTR